jgi:hypothetical protein
METTEKNRASRLLRVKDIVGRIEEFAKLNGENLTDLTQVFGFSKSYFTKAKSAEQSIGAEAIFLTLEYYRNLSPDWLLFGTGSMYRGGIAAEKKQIAINTEHRKINKNINESIEQAKKLKQMFSRYADGMQKDIDALSKLS